LSSKHALTAVVATGLITAAAAAAAFAANPIKGATYKGSWGTTLTSGTVQFKVSANGKKVSGFRLGNVPLHCRGVIPLASSRSAAVSKQGKFSRARGRGPREDSRPKDFRPLTSGLARSAN
jgi:opacity protein-like surface antigen